MRYSNERTRASLRCVGHRRTRLMVVLAVALVTRIWRTTARIVAVVSQAPTESQKASDERACVRACVMSANNKSRVERAQSRGDRGSYKQSTRDLLLPCPVRKTSLAMIHCLLLGGHVAKREAGKEALRREAAKRTASVWRKQKDELSRRIPWRRQSKTWNP